MKLRRIFIAYCLILVLLTMVLVACVQGEPGGTDDTNSVPGYYATATYGAEMYHAQQTAIAGGQP